MRNERMAFFLDKITQIESTLSTVVAMIDFILLSLGVLMLFNLGKLC